MERRNTHRVLTSLCLLALAWPAHWQEQASGVAGPPPGQRPRARLQVAVTPPRPALDRAPRARPIAPTGPSQLRLSSQAIETLVSRVMPSVVQVVATGYRPQEPAGGGATQQVLRFGRTLGSGVVVGAEGYVVTSAHVVQGVERVQVRFSGRSSLDDADRVAGPATRVLPAQVLGHSDEVDLALLRVDARDLAALPFADSDSLRQGELVFAFGSPDALRSSVSMGVVSAVAQQAEVGSPIVWIQTDAAVNPGNSGGPLVNADGALVGLNTFIRSMSGGSEGLGFALPSAVIALAYPQLRDYGHLHQSRLGIVAERVTRELQHGLDLATESGVIVADLTWGGPAAAAGIRIGDVITGVGGEALDSLTLARFNLLLLKLTDGQAVPLTVQRRPQHHTITVTAAVPEHRCQCGEPSAVRTNLIEPLGFIGAAVDESAAALMPGLRAPFGVVMVARVETAHVPEIAVQPGDVIHAVNGWAVVTPAELRDALGRIVPGDPVVLQVARNGALTYLVSPVE